MRPLSFGYGQYSTARHTTAPGDDAGASLVGSVLQLDRALALTAVTIAVSIVVHGISVTPLMRRYRHKAADTQQAQGLELPS